MSLEFRYAQHGEYPRISAFINEYWAKNHVYVRNPALFEWTFNRPGFWAPGQYSFSLGEDGGELVGILGAIPYTLNAFGETRRAVWIVNYAIRPDHRKGTAALKLLSTFRNPSFPVVIASGLNPASVAIYKVLRGKVLPETPRHVVVLPGAAERMTHLISLADPGRDQSAAAEIARTFEIGQPSEPDVEFGSDLPPNWDSADWATLASSTAGAVRDSNYLIWRYLNHPCFQYRIIAVKDKERTGLLIWRLETIHQASSEAMIEVDRIGRIVEFIPSSRANGKQLLAVLFQQLKNANAVGADFYGYHGATRSLLSECGIHDIGRHPDGVAIPSRFQPLSSGSGILNAMFAEPGLPECDSSSDCPWYWTKSDSDQDRPN